MGYLLESVRRFSANVSGQNDHEELWARLEPGGAQAKRSRNARMALATTSGCSTCG